VGTCVQVAIAVKVTKAATSGSPAAWNVNVVTRGVGRTIKKGVGPGWGKSKHTVGSLLQKTSHEGRGKEGRQEWM